MQLKRHVKLIEFVLDEKNIEDEPLPDYDLILQDDSAQKSGLKPSPRVARKPTIKGKIYII